MLKLTEGRSVTSSEDRLLGLARRLRSLRKEGLAGCSITQSQLAEALATSVPLISSWESTSRPKAPPRNRLEAYATFFASERSVANRPFRLLAQSELTPDEQERRTDLFHQLTALRDNALGSSDSIGDSLWHFPNEERVTIVCAELPAERRKAMPYADPDDPDYVRLYRLADLDALIEIHGHIRALNPTSKVDILTPSDSRPELYAEHLVVLGGVDWNPVTEDLLRVIDLPVGQMARESEADIGGFQIACSDKLQVLQPKLREENGRWILLEDVAHFYRGPNPFNSERTVTILNGMYGRGTLGAARALSDPIFRSRNEDYVRTRFATQAGFSIIARVYIVNGEVATPDWTSPETRLHEWPEESSEH